MLKIGVCIKSVPDTTAKITLDGTTGVVESGLKFVISPYDEFAVEQALLVKEAKGDAEVIAFSFGGAKGPDTLRNALAMGADRAVFIKDEGVGMTDTLMTARILKKAMEKEGINMLFTGRQAIDDDHGQVSQMLAEFLSWPHVTVVSQFELADDHALVMRDIEKGAKETWKVPLTSVFACSKGLNEPRYASLKGIMAAKKKPLDEVSVTDIGLSADEVASRIELSQFELPSVERKQQIFEEATPENVEALVNLLRQEAKVL